MAAITLMQAKSITATDYRCSRGPQDAPYPEQHQSFLVAYVRRGSFGYRYRGNAFELVAGSVLLGRPGDEYMCTHEHHVCGDECLAFSFAPDLAKSVGDTAAFWQTGCVPPASEAMVCGELAQAAAEGNSDIGLDEAAGTPRGPLRSGRGGAGTTQHECRHPRPSPHGGSRALARRAGAGSDRSG